MYRLSMPRHITHKKNFLYYISHYLILTCLTLICLGGSSANVITLASTSPNNDVQDYTTITNLDEFEKAIQLAIRHNQPKVILKSPLSNLNSYATILKSYAEIQSYTVECLTTGSKNTLTITLNYKQTYKILNAQTSLLAYNRLNDSDLHLLSVAQTILSQITNEQMTPFEKELAIHDYIIDHTTYDDRSLTSTHPPNSIYTAAGVLLSHKAVCEGYSEAAKLLLNLSHIPCGIIYGETKDGSHAWNLVQLDNNWYHLDVTFDDPVNYVNNKRTEIHSYNYFNVTDTILATDHTWDHSKWPAATQVKENYFVKSHLVLNSYKDFKPYIIQKLKDGNKEIICYVTDFDPKNYDLSFILNYCTHISYILPSSKCGSITIKVCK